MFVDQLAYQPRLRREARRHPAYCRRVTAVARDETLLGVLRLLLVCLGRRPGAEGDAAQTAFARLSEADYRGHREVFVGDGGLCGIL